MWNFYPSFLQSRYYTFCLKYFLFIKYNWFFAYIVPIMSDKKRYQLILKYPEFVASEFQ